jgi:uncharacterized membrane-anchored protein YitT (DUF2179 family)
MKNPSLFAFKRLLLVLTGSLLMAFTMNTFVKAGGILPGGFTGLVLLIQEICLRFFNFHLPFSVFYYLLNLIPAAVCFRFIGKKFALYSILMVVISGFLIDWMPHMFINFIQLHDTLLSAVFGGLLYSISISLCLHAGATSGGTDFIAIYISEKYKRDAWNYILAYNCVILCVAGFLFSLDKALYSIIFQYVNTAGIGILYKAYQQRTLFIITNMPNEIYNVINEKTHHGATCFEGHGLYENKNRVMLYSVITASEVKDLIPAIAKIDPSAFINVIKTDHLNGKFFQKHKD